VRVAVTGATGNVGTSVLRALSADPTVEFVLGIARRLPAEGPPKCAYAAADVAVDELAPLFRGADAVVHLAWAIQPSHDRDALWRTNVHGSMRVFRAAAEAGVHALVVASSVGVYSPRDGAEPTDESWPRDGVPTSWYARHKAEMERQLDQLEAEQPELRVVRLRPALTFKRESASEQRRFFLGQLAPASLLKPGRLPIVPIPAGLTLQGVHADDVADAYRLAVLREDARGAYNVAAEPVLEAERLAAILGGRLVKVPVGVARVAAALSWRAHLQPTSPDWLDLGLGVPVLDATRIRTELGWRETRDAESTLREWLAGVAGGAGGETPPLEPSHADDEQLTGVGERSG
jgi:nucleoside-diphosphate-sugar epimerase